MKKYQPIIISSIFLLFISVSCNEDFLKDELLSDTSVDFLYSSPEGLANAVVGLYVLQRQPYEQSTWQNASWNGMIPLVLTAKSDIAVGVDGEISLYSRLTWGSTRGDFGVTAAYDFFWSLNYKIIDRANAIIQGAQNLIDAGYYRFISNHFFSRS